MVGDTSTLPMLRNMSRSLLLNSQLSPSSSPSPSKSQKTTSKSQLSPSSSPSPSKSQKTTSKSLSLSSWAKAGAAASIRAASATTDASNIIFFIYSSLFLCLFVIPNQALAERHRALRLLVRKTHPFFFWVPSLGLLPCARFVGLAEEASAVRTRTALRVALWDACVHAQMREESGRD